MGNWLVFAVGKQHAVVLFRLMRLVFKYFRVANSA
jgi:hypothetical protein